MASIARVYTDAVHREFHTLYGTWLPGYPVKLGDFGKLDGNIFVRRGNVTDKFGITFKPRDDDSPDNFEFTSSNSVEIKFTAKGSITPGGIPAAKAGLEINFASSNSVFFIAATCKQHSIEDQGDLAKKILDLLKTGQWTPGHYIVTELVQAGISTIVASTARQASLSLEATSDKIENIDLADVNTQLSIKTARNVALKIVAEKELRPLIGLIGVQPRLLIHRPHWETLDQESYIEACLDDVISGAGSVEETFYLGRPT